jgi:hypothetical protein
LRSSFVPHAVAAFAERSENISFSEKSEKSENKKIGLKIFRLLVNL